MATISVTGPLEGEPVDLGSTKMRILEDGSTTDGRLGMAVSTLAPHTAGPPQHLHARHDEGIYVISGTARFTSGTDSYDARPDRWSWSRRESPTRSTTRETNRW